MQSCDALAAVPEGTRVVMVAGPGGVGKTSSAAALGVVLAVQREARVLVLTVDPARRLADALGAEILGDAPQVIGPELAAAVGQTPRGELSVAMVDAQAGWDALIARHAPDTETAARILATPLYASLTRRFVHAHDYLAMERLHELHHAGHYDIVVVDTPPSRNALDLLDAPERMEEFFSSRLLRWLSVADGSGSRLASLVAQSFQQVASRLLGPRFIGDITEFFALFRQLEPGFVTHAREVRALLADPVTRFVVVSTPDSAPTHEARFLLAEIRRRGLHLAAVIVNRVSGGPEVSVPDAQAEHPSVDLPADLEMTSAEVQSTLVALRERASVIAAVAEAEQRVLRDWAGEVPVVVTGPLLDTDIADLTALAALAEGFSRS